VVLARLQLYKVFLFWDTYYYHFLNSYFGTTCYDFYLKDSVTLKASDYLSFDIIIVWLQLICIATFTIWARGVGPRFRPDQMSDITWKDLLIFLALLFFLIIIIFWG
jgi:NADH:ubiquinone oxidoreductase subunit H